MTKISGNALKILACVMDRKHPSIKELGRLCGIPTMEGVSFHLRRLKRLGLLDWEPKKVRTLHPTCRFIPAEELP